MTEGTDAASTTAHGGARTDPRAVLVHGATSGPWVFDAWLPRWAGFDVVVPDLQAGLDVAFATMDDYADRVLAAAWAGAPSEPDGEAPPVVVCGWSMGGLVAMLAARRRPPAALVVVEPSVPLEVGGVDEAVHLEAGTYDVSAYGGDPSRGRHRPESRLARGERKRGISVPELTCPTLVVAGRDHGEGRGRRIAERYDADLVVFPELGHAALVADAAVADAVVAWARRALG